MSMSWGGGRAGEPRLPGFFPCHVENVFGDDSGGGGG